MSRSLFLPNNHSVFEITFRPADVEIRDLIAAGLVESYSFRAVARERIMQVNEAEQASNNFRVEVTLENGEAGTVLVRKHIAVSEERGVLFLERTLAFLQEKNIPVPHTISTLSGKPYCTFGGSRWQVFSFIEGNHYSGQREELISAAKGFATLHRALEQFPYREELRERYTALREYSSEALEQILEAAGKQRNELDATFIKNASQLREMVQKRDALRSTVTETNLQVVHGDLHPHNTIFSHGQLRAVLDFDMLHDAELAREVGFAAHRFARQHAVHEHGGSEAARVGFQLFLQAYAEEGALMPDGFQGIPYYLFDELLRRVITDFSRYYFEGVTRFATVQELEKKLTLLEEAEYLSSYVIS